MTFNLKNILLKTIFYLFRLHVQMIKSFELSSQLENIHTKYAIFYQYFFTLGGYENIPPYISVQSYVKLEKRMNTPFEGAEQFNDL